MQIRIGNDDLSKKIMVGINKAARKLFVESAEKNEKLVVTDDDGNIKFANGSDLLIKLVEKEQIELITATK